VTEPEGVPELVNDPCVIDTSKNPLPVEMNVGRKPAHAQRSSKFIPGSFVGLRTILA
jgi:hypothetical protein